MFIRGRHMALISSSSLRSKLICRCASLTYYVLNSTAVSLKAGAPYLSKRDTSLIPQHLCWLNKFCLTANLTWWSPQI